MEADMSTDEHACGTFIHCDQTVGEALEYGQEGPDAQGAWLLTVRHVASGLTLKYRLTGGDPARVLAKMAVEVENLVEALDGFKKGPQKESKPTPAVDDLWAKTWGPKR
jgi:hypothetical protein